MPFKIVFCSIRSPEQIKMIENNFIQTTTESFVRKDDCEDLKISNLSEKSSQTG